MKHIESEISQMVSSYLQIQYPTVIFRFDLGADLKLTIGQAVRNKKINNRRGYPDLFIAEPKGGYAGMYLELKKDYQTVFKQDGTLRKDEHLKEQKDMLEQLENKGYYANWGLGFESARKQIKEYLDGK